MEHEKLIRTVTAAQQGDSEALNTLFNAYYNDVYYFALKTVKDEELACDITQETFVEIINTLGQLQAPGAFVTWMKQITYHQCTRYFKKKKDVLVDEDEEGNTVFDTLAEDRAEFIPDAAMDQADFRKTILEMIDRLSEEQRSAVMMLYFDELSVKQIAEIQGVSEGTVKSRLNYARKAIRASVETYEKKNGIKLHSFGILPLLLWLFHGAGEAMPAAAAASVAAGVSAATGTAVAVSASAAATATTAATATAVAATAAKAASVPIAAKIAAGIVAAAVAVGGAAVGISQLPPEPTEPAESISSQEPQTYVIGEGCVYIDADNRIYSAGETMPAPRRGDEYRTPDYTYKLGYSLDRRVVESPHLPPWEMDWAGANEIEFYWREMPDLGWGAICNDNRLAVAPEVEASVNGLPLTYMGCAFFSAIHLTETPYIPDTVTDLRLAFFGCDKLLTITNLPSMLEDMSLAFTHCYSLLEVPQLPSGVTNMHGTFAYCWSLETAPDIPASVTQLGQCFESCIALTGTIRIDAQLSAPTECGMQCPICGGFDYGCRLCFACDSTAMAFDGTQLPIVLTGNCPYLGRLSQTSSKGNVTPEGRWVVPTGCTYTRGNIVYIAGDTAPANCQIGDGFNDDTYSYLYRSVTITDEGAPGGSVTAIGWNPTVIDKSASTYAPIRASINNAPVTMVNATFLNCTNLVAAPQIPDTVTYMKSAFSGCTALTAAPAIPEGVWDMSNAFYNCVSLEAAPQIPTSVLYMTSAFEKCTSLTTASAFPEGVRDISSAYRYTAITEGQTLPGSVYNAAYVYANCASLTGEIVIDASLFPVDAYTDPLTLFTGTTQPIVISGSCPQLNNLAGRYSNVTVK